MVIESPDSGIIESLALPARPDQVREARRFTEMVVADHPNTEIICLLVTELITNGIRHTRSRIIRLRINVRAAGMIRVDVTDEGGANVPHLRPHDSPTEAESGRGIRLVEALSDRWGVVRGQYAAGRRRTLVWFEVGTGAHRPGSCDLALTHL